MCYRFEGWIVYLHASHSKALLTMEKIVSYPFPEKSPSRNVISALALAMFSINAMATSSHSTYCTFGRNQKAVLIFSIKGTIYLAWQKHLQSLISGRLVSFKRKLYQSIWEVVCAMRFLSIAMGFMIGNCEYFWNKECISKLLHNSCFDSRRTSQYHAFLTLLNHAVINSMYFSYNGMAKIYS